MVLTSNRESVYYDPKKVALPVDGYSFIKQDKVSE